MVLEDKELRHKPTGWSASLHLTFARDGESTRVPTRQHTGPLRILKVHYPEGPEIAHTIIVHPPAGVVAGDSLDIRCDVQVGAHAVISTPGAQKWYRAPDAVSPLARARSCIAIASGAMCEWLPTEAIVFDGARFQQSIEFDIDVGARFLGWEMQQWGRTTRGERFTRGNASQSISLKQAGVPIWTELLHTEGGGAYFNSPTALGGYPCVGSMWIVAPNLSVEMLTQVRALCEASAISATCGATMAHPGLLVLKAVSAEMEPLRTLFVRCRALVRPKLCTRDGADLRIWAT